jgi:hypothetical protein
MRPAPAPARGPRVRVARGGPRPRGGGPAPCSWAHCRRRVVRGRGLPRCRRARANAPRPGRAFGCGGGRRVQAGGAAHQRLHQEARRTAQRLTRLGVAPLTNRGRRAGAAGGASGAAAGRRAPEARRPRRRGLLSRQAASQAGAGRFLGLVKRRPNIQALGFDARRAAAVPLPGGRVGTPWAGRGGARRGAWQSLGGNRRTWDCVH